ncbi:MAG: GxxExxY protein [Verrucomicrobiota bacterium]
MKFTQLSNQVIGCAIEVHKNLGPGLLESTYEKCLAYELQTHHINFTLQHPLPVTYKNVSIDCAYRIDILVDNQIILELKSVDEIKNIHQAQLITYMKLAKIKYGFLINFITTKLKNGLKSFIL